MPYPKIVLDDDQWMSIIDKDRDGLPVCCANVSALRDVLIGIARDGGQVDPFAKASLERCYGWVFADDEHGEASLVLRSVAAQAGLDLAVVGHAQDALAEFGATPTGQAFRAINEAAAALQRAADSIAPDKG